MSALGPNGKASSSAGLGGSRRYFRLLLPPPPLLLLVLGSLSLLDLALDDEDHLSRLLSLWRLLLPLSRSYRLLERSSP